MPYTNFNTFEIETHSLTDVLALEAEENSKRKKVAELKMLIFKYVITFF